MQQFGFAAIPLVVFTGGDGREIKRFTGYEPENKMVYMQTIDSLLHKE
jgi:thioredoxin-like negative regulator of GroEL